MGGGETERNIHLFPLHRPHVTLSLAHIADLPRTGSDRPPLLVLMHGIGGDEEQMRGLAERFDPRFLTLSVRGPLTLAPGAHAWFRVEFTPDGPKLDEEQALAAWQALARFRDEAVRHYAADPDRVFLAGFSQGGIMALAGLLTRPAAFAGAVCMSGRLPVEAIRRADEGVRGKPALVVHGRRDAKLPVQLARKAREDLQGLGVDVDYDEFDMAHDVSRESLDRVARWLGDRLE